MAKKKFYAVAIGKKTGIYRTWSETESQVKGYPGARFKGFVTEEEAHAWLAGNHNNQVTKGKRKKVKKESVSSFVNSAGKVIIYTDGGAINNPGPGGYGAIIVIDGREREFSGGFRLTTNNRMELMAAIVALKKLEVRDKQVLLFSDSSYLVNGIEKGWAKSWRRRGWIKSDKKPAINKDLWAEILDLVEDLDVEFRWVKGHSGNPMNERCDQMAVSSARSNPQSVDEGYEQ